MKKTFTAVLLSSIVALFVGTSAYAQGPRLTGPPFNCEFDRNVSISIINWQGQPAIAAVWDPNQVGGVWGPGFVAFGHLFVSGVTKRVRLHVQAAGFLYTLPPAGVCSPLPYSPPCYTPQIGWFPMWTSGFPSAITGRWGPNPLPLQIHTSAPGQIQPLEDQWGYTGGTVFAVYDRLGSYSPSAYPALVAMIFTVEALP